MNEIMNERLTNEFTNKLIQNKKKQRKNTIQAKNLDE